MFYSGETKKHTLEESRISVFRQRPKNSETSFTQSNATLVVASEKVDSFFDRKLGSKLAEPSQISDEKEAKIQRLSEQNNTKMTQIEQQLNINLEGILKEIRTIRDSDLVNHEEDAENNRPSTSNSEIKLLTRKRA